MTAEAIRVIAENVALVLFSVSFLVTIYRVIAGPSLPDRVVALDMLVIVAVGYIAIIGIRTGYTLYVDVAIGLALVGFLATVAFARFILTRGMAAPSSSEAQESESGEEGTRN